MSTNNYTSVFSVLHVSDYDEAIAWYSKWLGRAPDVTPTEGIAEWKLAENAWIQVSVAPDPSVVGKGYVVCGVVDLERQCSVCQKVGVSVGETEDYGFIKLANTNDPAGNTIVFVQEIETA
jgi:catechol 2,3-dioxygenase-like lactoylglutathione lyase family enzyme